MIEHSDAEAGVEGGTVNWTCDRCGHHENRRGSKPLTGPEGGE
jgi:hypothetical protein